MYILYALYMFSSIQFSCPVVSDSLRAHGWQHARLPCPSPTPGTCSNSCPSSRWCHPAISSSVVPFSFCLQSLPASESFPVSLFHLTSGGQSTGVSALASVLPMNIQDWFPFICVYPLHNFFKSGVAVYYVCVCIDRYRYRYLLYIPYVTLSCKSAFVLFKIMFKRNYFISYD